MPTHGTPPRFGSATASGLTSGAVRNIPALPIMTTTMPFLVRDMRSQSFCVVLRIRSPAGLTEPTIWEIADATKPALWNRCQGEAISLRAYRCDLDRRGAATRHGDNLRIRCEFRATDTTLRGGRPGACGRHAPQTPEDVQPGPRHGDAHRWGRPPGVDGALVHAHDRRARGWLQARMGACGKWCCCYRRGRDAANSTDKQVNPSAPALDARGPLRVTSGAQPHRGIRG